MESGASANRIRRLRVAYQENVVRVLLLPLPLQTSLLLSLLLLFSPFPTRLAVIFAPFQRTPSYSSHSRQKWPASPPSTSPRASPPPRCVAIHIPRRVLTWSCFSAGVGRGICFFFRAAVLCAAMFFRSLSIRTKKIPLERALTSSLSHVCPTARRRPPHFLRQGRRWPRPRAVSDDCWRSRQRTSRIRDSSALLRENGQ